ncbi:MAG: ParM/StbA family protein [Anaerolineae bacterium]|nr:ParM/StbA family protein [Anaerolineae bacterium]
MIVGVDIGYGYTKAACGANQVVFPSVVGKSERVRYESDLNRAGANQHDGQIAVITEQGDRFVGELALLQSRVHWTLLDRSRVQDPSARLLFLSALSELVGPTSEHGAFRVVTGLPTQWYADRDKVVEQLSGDHVLRRVNGRQVVQRFSIDELLVVPQPFGSLFCTILDADGRIVDEKLARGRLGIIDVGTFTTDYVLVDALRYIEKGSGSIATAMSRAYQLIGRSILDAFGLDLRLHEVDEIVRRGYVTVFGEQRDIEWLAHPVLDAIAEEVLAEAGTLWGDGRDLDAVLVTGGGAIALGDRIGRCYPHARTLDDAAMANVRGFERYGRRKWGAA